VPYNRFYLGGENDIRGFDFFTISPFVDIPSITTTNVTYLDPTRLGPTGSPTQQTLAVPTIQFFPTRPGGDTQIVTNLEYRIPIAGPVSMGLFTDLGIDGVAHQSQLKIDPAAFAQIQEQFCAGQPTCPFTSSRLQIIGDTNFKPHTSSGVELVVQLPIVNAPFRIYYAYNLLRLNSTIQGAAPVFNISQSVQDSLPPGVLQTQILPDLNTISQAETQRLPSNLIEPKHTFRFTVSRTF
jgi:outer membrane protein insertion porin family